MIARKDWQEDLLYFVYWINKINKQMKYLAGWRVVIWSAVNLVWPMAWRCCWVTLSAMVVDSTAHVTSACPIHIPNFKHRPQKILFAKKKKKKKKMIGWKIDLFFITENFLGIWMDYVWSLCAETMIFSVWHWPLLGQHPVDIIFFYSVYICQFAFCVLEVRCVKSSVGESEKIWVRAESVLYSWWATNLGGKQSYSYTALRKSYQFIFSFHSSQWDNKSDWTKNIHFPVLK